jgi:hypothetical protein
MAVSAATQSREWSAMHVNKAAIDLADYQRAYAATNGHPVEPESLIQHILAAFIEAGRPSKGWRPTATCGRTPPKSLSGTGLIAKRGQDCHSA